MHKTALFSLLALPILLCAGQSTIETDFETLSFQNSKKKDNGKRYGLKIGHIKEKHFYQFAYEKTDTNTFQPPMKEDLHVNKYTLKYTYMLHKKTHIEVSYQTIDDNLMKETDGGRIYGVGYGYRDFHIAQYISDYPHFNVYQTECMYHLKKHFPSNLALKVTLIGKYIHLQDKDSNNFSKNAKEDYFTPGIKLHAHRDGYHMGAAVFFGKRIFAIMNNGFAVQHHAMEFDKMAMVNLSKDFGNIRVKIKYAYQRAEEIPIHNTNVEVENIALSLRYRF